ncbi:MAG: hypothetical protein HN383_06440 [Verrucomicrobia bacterium]|nr:hypothetical protein [Verrucomicrobiota bacterium]
MLVVLNDLGVIRSPTHTALQIEDVITLPDILPDLYGTRKGRNVGLSDVEAYLSEVYRTKKRFANEISRQEGRGAKRKARNVKNTAKECG